MPNSIRYVFYNSDQLETIHESAHYAATNKERHDIEQGKVNCYAYDVQFMNANPAPFIFGTSPAAHKSNYFLGNDESKWKGNLPNYNFLTYDEIYPGIDAVFSGKGGNLKYDLVVSAGSNVNSIVLNYYGLKNISLRNGTLVLDAGFMNITEAIPVAYQNINGVRTEVNCEFVLNGTQVKFRFPERLRSQL